MRKVYAVLMAMVTGSALATATPVDNAAIDVVKKKLDLAVPYFARVWTQAFAKAGRQFAAPKVFAYTGTIQTGCGKLNPGNAYYCSTDKRIYLDAAYLADLVKTTAAETKTDGDYAGIVVAAHEFGHQLDHQLGTMGNASFDNEQHADCFAGAITREARNDRYLEPGDLEEARYALIIASDHWEPGGLVRRMLMRSREGAHGSATDRDNAFNKGYYVGAAACTSALGTAVMPPAGRVILETTFSRTVRTDPIAGTPCTVRQTAGEMVLTDVSRENFESCTVSLAALGNLPDHFRVEVEGRQTKGGPVGWGLFFGPSYKGAVQAFAAYARTDGSYALVQVHTPTLNTFLVDSAGPYPMVSKGLGARNRVAVDVHREQMGAAMLMYVNGRFAGMSDALFGWMDRKRNRNEQVGLYLGKPGMEAAFTMLRVTALSE